MAWPKRLILFIFLLFMENCECVIYKKDFFSHINKVDVLDSQCASRSVGAANDLLNTLVSAIIDVHCNISDPYTWPDDYGINAERDGLNTYDFVIVGGGTSGTVVARRLAENPNNKVLLIEAGGYPSIETEIPGLAFKTFFTDNDWQYPTRSNQLSCMAMKNESCVWNRGKVLGGTSAINAMLYSQGISRDYDWWEDRGNPMWGWRDVLPYFKKLEDFRGYYKSDAHGHDGPISIEPFWSPKYDQFLILEAAAELEHVRVEDFIDGNHLGFGWFYGTVKDGWRVSSAKGYLTGDKNKKKNLHVITNAMVSQIHFGKNRRADKVSFVNEDDQTMQVKVKKEVIISAGPIETPKLLMLSGIGPNTHLRSLDVSVIKDLPVGENLQDHVRVDLFFKFNYKHSATSEIRQLDAIYNQIIHQYGSYGAPTLDVGGYVNTRNSSIFPDIQFVFIPVANMAEFGANFKDDILRSFLKQISPSDHVIAFSAILLRPKSRGFVRLHSKDYRDKPLIIPNTFQKDADIQTIVQGIKVLMQFEETRAFGNYRGRFIKPNIPECNEEKFRSIKYWECYIKYMSNSFYEPAGTAKMGPSKDASSVVDSELRVRGVRGLRVVDASIMPSLVTGPITGPTIMIGERGADFILDSYKKKF